MKYIKLNDWLIDISAIALVKRTCFEGKFLINIVHKIESLGSKEICISFDTKEDMEDAFGQLYHDLNCECGDAYEMS